MSVSAALKSYAKVGTESGVIAADPHKLISMLYQGAALAIANGKSAMLRKDIPAKGAAISKAITIIDEGLKAALDKKAGGELAENLAALYDYMGSRLLSANLHNDVAALDEVSKLIAELGSAWDSIRSKSVAPESMPQPAPKKPELYAQPAANAARHVAPPPAQPAPGTVRPVQSANQNKLAAYGRV